MKPPIQYFGAKGAIADRIVALMPDHAGYIEPFAGSLAVLLAKAPAPTEIVNDLDHRLVTFWRVLRDRPEELIRAAALTPHSRVELAQAQSLDASDELELARQVWVLLTQGRSRTLQRTGWRFFAKPDRGGSSFGRYMAAYRDRLPAAASRIAEVSLECRPALEVIAQYGQHSGNLLYVDPPYITETRSGGRYSVEMSRQDHIDLAHELRKCSAVVMLSGYPSATYQELYGEWHQVLIPTTSANSTRPDRVEVIWSNRPLESTLFEVTA
ncbi:DNA adenine methylase [Microbacterium sp.]|uniref:DNA adenine methylase n=1 Tax=Microbacterium sp. TaxID=51671 RepID=UPI0039E6097B